MTDNNVAVGVSSFEVDKEYAVYYMSYSYFGGEFKQVSADIISNNLRIGRISFEKGEINVDIYDNVELSSMYMTDFIAIVNEIVTPAPVIEPDPVEEVL